jgi:hypothetical protein
VEDRAADEVDLRGRLHRPTGSNVKRLDRRAVRSYFVCCA